MADITVQVAPRRQKILVEIRRPWWAEYMHY
jgi:hypothetical protein